MLIIEEDWAKNGTWSQIKSIFVTELKMLFVSFKNKCAINCLSKEKGWERLFDERERERERENGC